MASDPDGFWTDENREVDDPVVPAGDLDLDDDDAPKSDADDRPVALDVDQDDR